MDSSDVFLTKAEVARRQIKKMITSGAVRPGDRLTTREVSVALGMSETPIREAIHGLAAEGWLSVQSHVGAVVQGLKAEQVQEISTLRGAVCALAIQLSAAGYDEPLLRRIDHNIEASEAALGRQDYDRFAQLNHEFHRLLCDRPETTYCYRILENMLGLMSSQRHGLPVSPNRLAEAIAEHRAIRDHLRNRDFDAASELARQHELRTGAWLIGVFKEAASRRATEDAQRATEQTAG
ncbi:MAG TPA: GntR family transcriptional regulator [Devosia sp.]|nr:GntR family transcriptional regulator [Devosia sp.]